MEKVIRVSKYVTGGAGITDTALNMGMRIFIPGPE